MNLHPNQPLTARRRLLPPPLVLLSLLLIGLIALPGCSGCWGGNTTATHKKKKEDEEKELEKKRKKKLEKPKDDFEPLAVRMLPSNDPTITEKTPPTRVKPGHWTAIGETAKANNFDFPGELATFPELPTNEPLVVENTTARLSIWCPAVLPKGQSKRIESLFYVPRRESGKGTSYSLRSELRGIRGGRVETFGTNRGEQLKDYQFLIVVLAANSVTPSSYSHFDKLHSVYNKEVEVPGLMPDSPDTLQQYFVLRPAADRTVPLPSHPLAWTTIAYIFWDDVNPGALTNQQQQALIDWLHFGGQLIISGPSSLDKLKGSFLASYLPAEVTQTVKLEQPAFEDLNATFSLQRDPKRASLSAAPPKGDNLRRITIIPDRPMLGIELNKHAETRDIEGTGGLVVERRIGGGRIVVTRFPLTDVRIKQWRNFDGFFNGVLLRRPAREFGKDDTHAFVTWAAPQFKTMLLEARLSSTLRYFSRDIGYLERSTQPPTAPAPTTADEPTPNPVPVAPAPYPRRGGRGVYLAPDEPVVPRPETWTMDPDIDDWHLAGYHSSPLSGVAGWNDEGAASAAAREALTEAAGIQIPRAEFVMQVLAVYLLVLVPINWLIFWLIGRVEWAWIAAPVIALAGAGAVIRLAQLDIGFARSRTEIGILEMQSGFERAHLTRYTALYSSLSSNYTLAFADPSSLALPLAAGPRKEGAFSLSNYSDVSLRRDKETALSGVQVSSNSTGMVHSEQMLGVGGKLTLIGDSQRGYSLKNTTSVSIHDVGIFRRSADGSQVLTAFVAKLEPNRTVPLNFSPLTSENSSSSPNNLWLPEWEKANVLAQNGSGTSDDDKSRIRLTRLAQLATQQLRLMPGDVRLVGWTAQRLEGLEIRPDAPQNTTYSLVLAHLARGSLPTVKPDKNVAEDYLKLEEDEPTENTEPATATEPPTTNGSQPLTPNP